MPRSFWKHLLCWLLCAVLSLAPLASPQSRVAAAPISPLIFGTNLGLFNAQDQFLVDPHTRAALQQIHVTLIRVPIRTVGGISPDEVQALQDVQAMGDVPLVILKYSQTNPLAADQMVLQSATQIFGTAPVYAEFGNERDLAGVDQVSYTNTWNSILPTLKAQFPSVRFGGPVNFQYNPPYVAYFVHNANPKPDFISWHEYTCGNTDSAQYCIDHIANWATHIALTRQAITANGDAVPPIFISEWNYDPNNPYPDLRATAQFQQTFTQDALAQLAAAGVTGAAQYVATGHEYYNLVNPDGTLSPEGVAFGQAAQAALSGNPGAPPTPVSPSATATTPAPSATAAPASTATNPAPSATAAPASTATNPAPPATSTALPGASATNPAPSATPITAAHATPATAATGSMVIEDTFNRADQMGWGTASSGQAWGADAAGSPFAIAAGRGEVSQAGNPVQGVIGPALTDSAVLLSGEIGSFVDSNFGVLLRWQDPNDWYKVYLDGSSLVVQKSVQGNHTILTQVPFPATPNTSYTIRAQMLGTTLDASVWPTGAAAPVGWMAQAGDASLASGQDGVRLQLISTTADLSAFVAQQVSPSAPAAGTAGATAQTQLGGGPLPVPGATAPAPTDTPTTTNPPTTSPLVSAQTATGSVVVEDTFNRPDQVGWGTASSGQAWGGDAAGAPFTIASTLGYVTSTSGPVQGVIGPALADSAVLLSGAVSAFTNNNLGVVLRWQDSNDWYKIYIDGASLVIQRSVQGNHTILTQVPFAALAGVRYTIRAQISGNTIQAMVWPAAGNPPEGWMAQTTDASLTQGQDGIRLQVFNATAAISAFVVQQLS